MKSVFYVNKQNKKAFLLPIVLKNSFLLGSNIL